MTNSNSMFRSAGPGPGSCSFDFDFHFRFDYSWRGGVFLRLGSRRSRTAHLLPCGPSALRVAVLALLLLMMLMLLKLWLKTITISGNSSCLLLDVGYVCMMSYSRVMEVEEKFVVRALGCEIG